MQAAAVLLALAAVSGQTGGEPVARAREDRLELSSLPPVIAAPPVARHLRTGLTTTFVLHVEVPATGGTAATGGAQVEIRYDLWDERYNLAVTDSRGGPAVSGAAGEQELLRWWRSLVLTTLAGWRMPGDGSRAEVTLVVLPFSRAEQEDTRAWFLRSLAGAGESSIERASPTATFRASGRPADLSSVLLAASIGRRSLLTFVWNVPVVAEGGP